MPSSRVCLSLTLLCASFTGSLEAQQEQELAARIERLTAVGNTSAARLVVDSVLVTAPEGSEPFVEALYWDAVLNSTAAGAERGYLRIVVEYPLSSRASAALLRLAELELARQARDRAQRHLEKILSDYPQSRQTARAQYLTARMALDEGQAERACSLLSAARETVDASDVELRNQILYLHASCASAPPPAATDSSPPRDSAKRAVRAGNERGRYTIQIAAYNTEREAAALSAQLKRRGLSARVVGTRAPFRVRVGRYASREAARQAMAQARLRGIIVEAEPS